MTTTRLIGSASNQVPRNRDLGSLAYQDNPPRTGTSVIASSAGLQAVTTMAGSLTLTTGGVTLLNQIVTQGAVWRVVAYGTYVASSSANVRQLTMRCVWGGVNLTAVTTGNVLASTVQTTQWKVEFEITGQSTSSAWITGFLSSQVTSATIPLNYVVTPTSVTGITQTNGTGLFSSTLDFQIGQAGTVTSGDTINVHSVTMERIQ